MDYIFEEKDDFDAWHQPKFDKPEEGKRVMVYFSYRNSSRQRYRASGYGYATWTKYFGWKVENFPGEVKVHSWQYPDKVDWDQMLYNYNLISWEEYKHRLLERR